MDFLKEAVKSVLVNVTEDLMAGDVKKAREKAKIFGTIPEEILNQVLKPELRADVNARLLESLSKDRDDLIAHFRSLYLVNSDSLKMRIASLVKGVDKSNMTNFEKSIFLQPLSMLSLEYEYGLFGRELFFDYFDKFSRKGALNFDIDSIITLMKNIRDFDSEKVEQDTKK